MSCFKLGKLFLFLSGSLNASIRSLAEWYFTRDRDACFACLSHVLMYLCVTNFYSWTYINFAIAFPSKSQDMLCHPKSTTPCREQFCCWRICWSWLMCKDVQESKPHYSLNSIIYTAKMGILCWRVDSYWCLALILKLTCKYHKLGIFV